MSAALRQVALSSPWLDEREEELVLDVLRSCRLSLGPTVDRFDKRLDTGTEILECDLRRMQQANMAERIDQFVRALEAGAILPEDF